MALGDSTSVDLVTKPFPGDDCKLVLFVVDDGSIQDELLRYRMLIEKLTGYVNYVASPEFAAGHPGVAFCDVLVRVLCVTPPNDAMREVQAIGARGDPKNRLRVVFADYHDFKDGLRKR